jgi:hypothetical protein
MAAEDSWLGDIDFTDLELVKFKEDLLAALAKDTAARDAETARKDAEIEVLRELLHDATVKIDGEWGNGNWDGNLDDEYLIPHLIWVKLNPDLPQIA